MLTLFTGRDGAETGGRSNAAPLGNTFRAGTGKTTAVGIAFLILAPFFVSLPVMLYRRVVDGLWFDFWQLAFFALCFAAVMALLFVRILYGMRAKLLLGERAFTFTLPAGRGLVPALKYRRQTIAYADIAEVELRHEAFGGNVLPVVLQGAHVITKKGRDVLIGFVSDVSPDRDFPFDEIGREIAARAGVPVIEEPGLWRTLHSKSQAAAAGLIAGDAHMVQPEEVARINRNHRRLSLALINVLVAILLVGIASDIAAEKPTVGMIQQSAPERAN